MRNETLHAVVILSLGLVSGCVSPNAVRLRNDTGQPVTFCIDALEEKVAIKADSSQPVPYTRGQILNIYFDSGRELEYNSEPIDRQFRPWFFRPFKKLDLRLTPNGTVEYAGPHKRSGEQPPGFPMQFQVVSEDPSTFKLPAQDAEQVKKELMPILDLARNGQQVLRDALIGSLAEKESRATMILDQMNRLLSEDKIIFTNPHFPLQGQTWRGSIIIVASGTKPTPSTKTEAEKWLSEGKLIVGNFVFDLEQTLKSIAHESYHLLRNLKNSRNEEWEAELTGCYVVRCANSASARPWTKPLEANEPDSEQIHEVYGGKAIDVKYPNWFLPLPPPLATTN